MPEFSFDLHMHSCLSPCGSEDNTPNNLAGMCALAGLDIVALTDHNAVGNCGAFLRAAERYGLLALPGMELTCAEEVHVVCLFPGLAEAEEFGALVRGRLPPVKNQRDIYGPQILMDENDNALGEEDLFYAGAAAISSYEAAALAAAHGGLAYPAHIDRPSFSLLANLGLWDPDMGFALAEISGNCPPGLFDRPDLKGVPHVAACDAHYLDQIPDAHQYMELPERTPRAALAWLKNGCRPLPDWKL